MREAASTATRRALGKGRRLFNSGRFFEAHEVWEEAWLREAGESRQLLQGLIQIAAGYHQAFDRGHASGCVRLLEAGWNRLQALPERTGGLSLAAFRDAVATSLEQARAWHRGQTTGLLRSEAPLLRVRKGVKSV
jgi:uncharacterized protein